MLYTVKITLIGFSDLLLLFFFAGGGKDRMVVIVFLILFVSWVLSFDSPTGIGYQI